MPLSNLLQSIKQGKPFKKADLIIYSVITLIVCLIFVFFALFNNTRKPTGFSVSLNDQVIITCNYNSSPVVKTGFEEQVEIEGNKITVYTSIKKTHYNVIEIDHENMSVDITMANCSLSHDCTFLPPIKNGQGALICVPNNLIIKSITGTFTPPVTG